MNTAGIHVNSTLSITSLTLAGAASGVTTLATGNTTITGFANVTGNVQISAINATSFGTTLTSNTTTALLTIGNSSVSATVNSTYFTGSAAAVVQTVTGTTSAELVRGNMGDNDQARILIGATATNAGYLEIATADDGTEPIYVRQYSGVFSSLTRTLTLLDGSGNSNFPGAANAASHTVGSSFIANSTGVTSTGFANVSTSVNSASHTVGTSFIANSTGVYHTGTVNAASHTVGSSFIANSTGVTSTGFANVSTTLTVGGNSSITGNLVVSGITTLTGNVSAGANVSAKALILDNAAIFSNTATVSNTTQNIIDSFPKASYSFGKLILTVKPSSGTERHATEILLLHDNTDVLITEYAQLFNTSLGSFDAGINNANVEIYFTSTSANASVTQTVKVIRQSS